MVEVVKMVVVVEEEEGEEEDEGEDEGEVGGEEGGEEGNGILPGVGVVG